MIVKRKFMLGSWALGVLMIFSLACEDSRVSASLASLQIQPDPVSFGQVPVSTRRVQPVTLVNTGTAALFLHGLDVTENEQDFSVRLPDGAELPVAIAPRNQFVFDLLYHPQQQPEQDTGTVRLTTTDASAPEYDLAVGGQAVQPILLVTPNPVVFDTTRVLAVKPTQLTISHTGSSQTPVTLSRMELLDDGQGDFGMDSPTLHELAPGDQLKVEVTYRPQAIDDADIGLLLIESDAASQERIEVDLIGNSQAPVIRVAPTRLDFGSVEVDRSPTLTFTVFNDGNTDLQITGMTLAETGSPRFSFDPTSLSPVPPMEQATITVTYHVDGPGDDEGVIRITHDDPLSQPIFVQLAGRSPSAEVEIVPDYLTMQLSGSSTSQTHDIRIYNLGDMPLEIYGLQFENPDGSFAIESEPEWTATIQPGDLQNGPYESVRVRFSQSQATVDDHCSLTFTTSDPDEPTVVVTVVGSYTP